MKSKLFFKFFVFAVIAAFVTVTSCKDYDDDINDLKDQISELSSTLSTLKAKIDAGAVITKVESTTTGVIVTLSDGKTFTLTNGKDGATGATGPAGATGADGKPGSVVTANADGFWYIDGVKTKYTWKGEKGADGAPGTNGSVYVPNADGYWYKDGVKTDQLWLLPGVITAVVNEAGDVTFSNIKSGDSTNSITFYNNKLLRSLVLIPDYYVNGIEAINFSTIRYESVCTDEVATINPKVLVQYHVNPSSVTEDMIDTENMSFVYQLRTNYFRSAEINATAKFVSLKDGILTVEATIDATKAESVTYEMPTLSKSSLRAYQYSETFDIIALQVNLSDKALNDVAGAEATVTSDYGRVDVVDLNYPQIDRKGTLDDWDTYSWDYNTVESAKDEVAPYLIEVPYDKTVNLVDYVTTFAYPIEDREIDLDTYGLEYKFDLIDGETGEPIEYVEAINHTDQQDFINLSDSEKGTITSKTYNTTGTAAIGRTPIVRVQLIDTQNNCTVTYGYIKIKFVKDAPALEKDFAKTVNFNCDETAIGVNEQWMNTNIYNPLKLSSAQFHNQYSVDVNVYDASGVAVPELGHVDNLWDVWYSGQTTMLFQWHIDKDAINESTSKVLTGYVYYRSMIDNTVAVKIKVTATVTMPVLSVYGHNATYWENTTYSTFKVNPIVYLNSEANPTANIRTNLMNGFVNKDGVFTSDEALIVKSSIDGFTPANVKFEFDAAKLATAKYYIGTTEYSVAEENLVLSADKQTLYFVINGTQVKAATIQKVGTVYRIALDEAGTEAAAIGSSLPTAAAKALVGKTVPVRISADLCGEGDFVQSVKSYDVKFIAPIKINSALSGNFVDAVVGGSKVSVKDALSFTDWNNYVVRATAFTTPTTLQQYAVQLYGYYALQTPEWDITNAKTNLKLVDGNLVPTAGYTDGALPSNYVLTYANNELIFNNNSGSPINTTTPDFTIYIPVSVDHKWGTVTATVAIPVKAAAGTGAGAAGR